MRGCHIAASDRRVHLLLAAITLTIWAGASPAAAQRQAPSRTPTQSRSSPESAKEHADIERSPDAYAIYSLLVPGEALAKMAPSLNQRWAIAAMTVNASDISPALAPEAALQPPKDDPRGFREAAADYQARKNERLRLVRDFHLTRPYSLLTPEEVNEFRTARSTPTAPSALRQKYSGYPGITYFSQVFFNSKRSAALVYMVDWCGNLCAGGQWVYLEKQGGRWIRRSGRP